MSTDTKATTAIGAALEQAASKTPIKVKAADAPPSQTPPEKSSTKKVISADDAIKSAQKTVAAKKSTTATKTSPSPAAKTEAESDPAQFLQVGAAVKPSKPTQWFPDTYTLATKEGVKDSAQGKVIEIRLYSEGCTECASLVAGLEEEGGVEKCHFSLDNIYCPAAYLRIRFVGQKLRLLHKIRKAQEKHDVNRMMALMAGLDELSSEDRLDVLKELGMLPPEAKKEEPKTVAPATGEQDYTER